MGATADHNKLTQVDTQHSDFNCMRQFGPVSSDEHGITVSTCIAGHSDSSYRSEGIGAIVALAKPGPAHVGIDNAACLNTACQLLELAQHIPPHADLDSKTVRYIKKDRRKGK